MTTAPPPVLKVSPESAAHAAARARLTNATTDRRAKGRRYTMFEE
jgi:hypothetical protein